MTWIVEISFSASNWEVLLSNEITSPVHTDYLHLSLSPWSRVAEFASVGANRRRVYSSWWSRSRASKLHSGAVRLHQNRFVRRVPEAIRPSNKRFWWTTAARFSSKPLFFRLAGVAVRDVTDQLQLAPKINLIHDVAWFQDPESPPTGLVLIKVCSVPIWKNNPTNQSSVGWMNNSDIIFRHG